MSREPYLLMKNKINYAALKNGENNTIIALVSSQTQFQQAVSDP